MTEEIDEQIEDYVEKKRGKELTDDEKEAFDDFVERLDAVAKSLLDPAPQAAELRRALTIHLARRKEIPPFMTDSLTMIGMFVAELMSSWDEKTSLDFVRHVLAVFGRV
mgnify:CR=1 FL=1